MEKLILKAIIEKWNVDNYLRTVPLYYVKSPEKNVPFPFCHFYLSEPSNSYTFAGAVKNYTLQFNIYDTNILGVLDITKKIDEVFDLKILAIENMNGYIIRKESETETFEDDKTFQSTMFFRFSAN